MSADKFRVTVEVEVPAMDDTSQFEVLMGLVGGALQEAELYVSSIHCTRLPEVGAA